MEDKCQQAPEDKMIDMDDYSSTTASSTAGGASVSRGSKSKSVAIHGRSGKNEALKLDKFMTKACPVMEQVIEENE